MENVEFTIDSKDKNVLSKGTRILYFALGFILMISGLIIAYRLFMADKINIMAFLNLLIILLSVLAINRGFI
jgi:hypothetical protein